MNRTSLHFIGPGRVEIREEAVGVPLPHEVLVETLCSAVSSGSELLLYRGLCPPDLPLDESIPSLKGASSFPVKYGYSTVGRVVAAGVDVSGGWTGRRVFAFHPHESSFIADPAELLPVPADISDEEALFLPNLETAINFVMDGRPVIGERAAVLGQGVVGLLTTALLALHPLETLSTFDRYPLRRQWSQNLGASAVFDPALPLSTDGAEAPCGPGGVDLIYELSGDPGAIDLAVGLAGFASRIVVGSWYGLKKAPLNLGGRFHRSRIRMTASQVSTIDPEFTGRWTKARRLSLVWPHIRKIQPARLITHRFAFGEAERAYEFLDRNPEAYLQVVFTY